MAGDDILQVLWRRKWVFLLTFAVVLGSVALVTSRLPKVYESTSYLLVSPAQAPANAFEYTQVSETLTATYGELLGTDRMARDVQQFVGPGVAEGDVGDRIAIEVGETQLISLTGEGSSPREAQLIANAYGDVFVQRLEERRNPATDAGVVRVAEYGTLPGAAVRPRPALYLAIGAILAALAGAALALLRHRLDQRLDVRAEHTEVLGLPILARIPEQRRPATAAPASNADRRAADAYRLLLVNLSFANLGQRPRTIAVVSSAPQEGKSTTALSVARAADELGIRTLLVDADLRRPSVTGTLGFAGDQAGLSSLLVADQGPLEVVTSRDPESGVRVLPSGPIPPNPAALLGTRAFEDAVADARDAFDFTVVDSPPLAVAADASLIAAQVDGVVVVIDAKRTRRNVATQALDQLRRSQANVLGAVLNRASDSAQQDYYGPRDAGLNGSAAAPAPADAELTGR